MKGLIIKIDRKVLDVLTQYVRRWVEWQEHKKHAIDLMIKWEWFEFGTLIVWAITIPTVLYIVEGELLNAGIHVAMWSMLAVFELFSIQYTKGQMKPLHDYMFGMREDPTFSKVHAEMLDRLFVESRRQRLKTTAFIVGITAVLFVVAHLLVSDQPNNMIWQYLFFNAISMRLRGYLLYVNDFDPPKKKKKASDSITEMLRQLWAGLTQEFVPQPVMARSSNI